MYGVSTNVAGRRADCDVSAVVAVNLFHEDKLALHFVI
jgi:hypothetical protein